ncbi:MAG: DUF3987 domain-containing protein [Planctomycetota bacterium]|nr:DUF3987 domain-containing protein [Planctomycetota bacterium]
MNPDPFENFLARLQGVRRIGRDKATAFCPLHENPPDGHKPSLSVARGDGGRVLLKCLGGCATADVVKAAGLEMSDLFADTAPPKGRAARPWLVTTYPYRDENGTVLFEVCRYIPKDFRQRRPDGNGGWIWSLDGVPRVLYRLPELLAADKSAWVFVVEGEKDVDNVVALGLVATTNPGGAGKWKHLANDSALHGRHVAIIPDRDKDDKGRQHALDVARALHGKAADVRIVELPDVAGMTVKDASDWIMAQDAQASEDLARALVEMAEAAPTWTPSPAEDAPAPAQWHPFPVEALPPACRRYVQELSQAIGTDPSFAALSLLAALAGAVGNTRRIRIKHDWQAPAVLWTLLVGESGTMKTAVLKHVLAPVYRRQADAIKAHETAMDKYKADLLAQREKSGRAAGAPAPVEPSRPVLERFVVSDCTVEALADRLQDNPRGLLLAREELSGWVCSFNQYKNVRGADEAHWVTMFDASNLLVDRKTGDKTTIYVPRAAVSIVGGIQPGILRRVLTAEYQESGLAARLLMVMPPRRPKRWTERELSARDEQRLDDLYANLWKLVHDVDDNGERRPLDLPLTADAKSAFAAFVNSHGQEAAALTDSLAAAWAKLENYAARLALVVELARWAENPGENGSGPSEVSSESVRAALEIVEWAKHETRRIYAMLNESDEEQQARHVVEYVQRRGGRISARDLHKGMLKRFPTSDDADLYLRRFVPHTGHWVDAPPGPKGGRPTRFFVLSGSPESVDKTQNPGNPSGT